MPFCHAPWTNIDISPQGEIGPCCKFRHEHYEPPLDIRKHTIDQYLDSPTLIKIKQEFMEGQWPAGCERCRLEESHGLPSKRIMDHQRWQDHYANISPGQHKFITASVAFGNTCNLTCITCGPYSSSRWNREHVALFGTSIEPNHFYKKDFAQEILDAMPDLVHLDIPGGEPFLSGVEQQKELLALYGSRAHMMDLHYTTNATVFPTDDWWDLWKDFREIDLQISLDAVDARLEYIRYPAKWSEVVGNIASYLDRQTRLQNFRMSVSITVSAYNVAYLGELLDWCEQMGLPKPWLGRVHNPVHMRPTVWPQRARRWIADRLASTRHDSLHAWAGLIQTEDDSKHFDQFKSMMSKHDHFRGTRFDQAFPEMVQFL